MLSRPFLTSGNDGLKCFKLGLPISSDLPFYKWRWKKVTTAISTAPIGAIISEPRSHSSRRSENWVNTVSYDIFVSHCPFRIKNPISMQTQVLKEACRDAGHSQRRSCSGSAAPQHIRLQMYGETSAEARPERSYRSRHRKPCRVAFSFSSWMRTCPDGAASWNRSSAAHQLFVPERHKPAEHQHRVRMVRRRLSRRAWNWIPFCRVQGTPHLYLRSSNSGPPTRPLQALGLEIVMRPPEFILFR